VSRPWTAEREVTPELAAELISAQFPALAGAPVVLMAAGWDNVVYQVGGEWVFRFPQREIAVALAGKELTVLPRLAPLLPLPVPVPVFAGTGTDRYPWPFWGARRIPGTELAQAGLPDTERGPAARAAGEFLGVLHDPALAGPIGASLPADPNRRGDIVTRAQMAARALDRLAGERTWRPERAVLDLLDRAGRSGIGYLVPHAAGGGLPAGGTAQARPGQAAVICHGDLHVRHLLVDAGGLALGVIDWGDLCLADPAIDLSLAYAAFTGRPRAELFAAYGRSPGPEQELRARVLAVFLSAMLAEYARAQGWPALLAESLAGLRRAVTDEG